jgi:hypothetical protein
VGTAILLAACAGTAFAGQAFTAADPRTSAGVRAFIDPRTGQATASPSPEQLQRLVAHARAATLSRSVEGLRPFELQRGGRGLNLHGRFQTALRVQRAADGTFHVTCGDGEAIVDAGSHQHHAADSQIGGSPTAATVRDR